MSRDILKSAPIMLSTAVGALAALAVLVPVWAAQTDSAAPVDEAAATGGAAASGIDALVAAADPQKGATIGQICGNCHTFVPDGGIKTGPNLFGVAGRPIASFPFFPYSQALSAKAGKMWTNEALDEFLTDPGAFAPGTKMTFDGLKDEGDRAAVIAWLRSLPEGGPLPGDTAEAEAANEPKIDKSTWRLVRDGLVIDLSITPAGPNADKDEKLMQGMQAEVAFRITDEATGEPVPGLYPGAWMDMAKPWGVEQESSVKCKDRAGLYLQGQGFKPEVDMNSYFMLVLNREPKILVFDPLVNVSGSTMLYAQINLKRSGADWAKSLDERWLFVSMPRADQVAVVDTNVFKVAHNVDAGVHPVRTVVQPDGKYLWVGNDSKVPAESGVTVIDTETLNIVAQIPTGAGHHEIVLSDDSRTAWVSNRNDGTISIIDVQGLKKIGDIRTGPKPISMAFSPLSKSLYVADAQTGVISVIDPGSEKVTKKIQAMAGLGPLRFDQTGRWGFVVNSDKDLVYAIDASSNRIAFDYAVGSRPFQVVFSRTYAYVRSLGSERVGMINLQEMEKGRKPAIVSFPAGDKPPEEAPELNLADTLVEAPGEAAVLVTSPADATVYYYMEGMNAPMGAFRNYGNRPLAVNVVDRALREMEPGVYATEVPFKSAGIYEIALIMDSPQILHCFRAVAVPNPLIEQDLKPLDVEYLVEGREVAAGEPFALRFQLTDPANGRLRTGLEDVRVMFYRAPGQYRTEVAAKEVSAGIYEAILPIKYRGAYYIHVSSRSLKVNYGDMRYLTVLGVRKKPAAPGTQPNQG